MAELLKYWECCACWTGKDARLVEAYDCGKHYFHEKCLYDVKSYLGCCPMCLMKDQIKVGLIRKSSVKPSILKLL